jgi:hypothetical protein
MLRKQRQRTLHHSYNMISLPAEYEGIIYNTYSELHSTNIFLQLDGFQRDKSCHCSYRWSETWALYLPGAQTHFSTALLLPKWTTIARYRYCQNFELYLPGTQPLAQCAVPVLRQFAAQAPQALALSFVMPTLIAAIPKQGRIDSR